MYQLTSLLTLFTSILCQDSFLTLRHRSPPRPPLHVAWLPLCGSPAVLLWRSNASCVAADRYPDDLAGSVRGIADVDNWTIRSPKAPLPCHRCEYGGYRGTWSSVNESLLTYLWRNSVKDFPRLNQSNGSRDREDGGGRRRRGTCRRGGLDAVWPAVSDIHASGWWHTCLRPKQSPSLYQTRSSNDVWRKIKLESRTDSSCDEPQI